MLMCSLAKILNLLKKSKDFRIYLSEILRTFAMIKPDCYQNIGKIIDIIEHSGFVIGNIKMAKMTLGDAEEFYAEHKVGLKSILSN